jgi:hypothetical protein
VKLALAKKSTPHIFFQCRCPLELAHEQEHCRLVGTRTQVLSHVPGRCQTVTKMGRRSQEPSKERTKRWAHEYISIPEDIRGSWGFVRCLGVAASCRGGNQRVGNTPSSWKSATMSDNRWKWRVENNKKHHPQLEVHLKKRPPLTITHAKKGGGPIFDNPKLLSRFISLNLSHFTIIFRFSLYSNVYLL